MIKSYARCQVYVSLLVKNLQFQYGNVISNIILFLKSAAFTKVLIQCYQAILSWRTCSGTSCYRTTFCSCLLIVFLIFDPDTWTSDWSYSIYAIFIIHDVDMAPIRKPTQRNGKPLEWHVNRQEAAAQR